MKETNREKSAYKLGLHHGSNGAAPRVGKAVEVAASIKDPEKRIAYLDGVRTGWMSKKSPTPHF